MMSRDLIEKKTREGAFILTTDGETLFSLNDVGSLIWNGIKNKKTRDEIIRSITTSYDVGERQAGSDLDIFLKDIRKYSSELMIDHSQANPS